MGLRYENLDAETRRLMLEEIEADRRAGAVPASPALDPHAARDWPALTAEAARSGGDDSLAMALSQGRLKQQVERKKPRGGWTVVDVPVTAPMAMAEAQFNLYYMRALARRAIASGARLEVYRAKTAGARQAASQALVGARIDPQFLLDELRALKGDAPRADLPLPNSGLCVRLAAH